jgi:hypothetical protein
MEHEISPTVMSWWRQPREQGAVTDVKQMSR